MLTDSVGQDFSQGMTGLSVPVTLGALLSK